MFTQLLRSLWENKKINPYPVFFTGEYNDHYQMWCSDGDTSTEEREIQSLISSLGLKQMLTEPTILEPNKNSTCMDLILTRQSNLVLDSGTRHSLNPDCRHQRTYCQTNLQIPPPPPSERKIWHYGRANITIMKWSDNGIFN